MYSVTMEFSTQGDLSEKEATVLPHYGWAGQWEETQEGVWGFDKTASLRWEDQTDTHPPHHPSIRDRSKSDP